MKAQQGQKRQLEEGSWGQRDRGCDGKCQASWVKEGLMTAKGDADLFWEGGAQCVVHRWGEGHKEGHVPKGITRPPQFRRASWSLVVSQRTEQKRDCRVRFFMSLKEKLSASFVRDSRSSSWSIGGY